MEGGHPQDPISNVSKFTGYSPEKYTVGDVSLTVRTDESLTPGRPPCLTQQTIGKYLQPLTRELSMVAPAPTIDELPDKVIDNMVLKDKAFWVDKPGANAYTLHDAYYNYGMTTEIVKPPHQDVFPRSYQYDLDCVRYRRTHACDGLKSTPGVKHVGMHSLKRQHTAHLNAWDDLLSTNFNPTPLRNFVTKPPSPHCRDCTQFMRPGLTPFQLAWAQDAGQKRWRDYPDLTDTLDPEEIRKSMNDVGRPYKNEACNWYYKNYPSIKYDMILRKFSK